MRAALLTLGCCGLLLGCVQHSGTDDDSVAPGFAPADIVGLVIRFIEDGGVDHTWTFDADTATLDGVDTFPYTYQKTGGDTSVVDFDVQGIDRYEMTWTSDGGGDCTESFEGSDPVPCTFTVQ